MSDSNQLNSFGKSIHLDCRLIEEDNSIYNLDKVRKMFKEIIESINMKLHFFDTMPAMISDVYAPPDDDTKLGCSITALLSTSSASIHTTKTGIHIDIFSCHNEINIEGVVGVVKKYYNINTHYFRNELLRI